ncbi:hypothetical protein PG993_012582 [Apiospora rasikravindrae]|uniref:SET domain-containing protein n=1 Tax=Apiospora rasikravindrae TaxID=990691 RepID=A0ABR1S4N0_9PEZI
MAEPRVPIKWREAFFNIHGKPGHSQPSPLVTWKSLKHRRQSETGNYDFPSMYQEAEADPPLVDCATFAKPVEVRKSLAERGSGLFTTQNVSAGDLLLCEKALGYAWAEEQFACRSNRPGYLAFSDTKVGLVGGQARLLAQLIQKLRLNPEIQSLFQQLYCGEYKAVADLVVDGQSVVDTFHVAKVIALSGMGAPRSSRADFQVQQKNRKRGFSQPGYFSCGLWSLASHINHCCIANCRRSFIGDMLILRATRDLAEGDELFFNYYAGPNNGGLFSREAQRKLTRVWGYTCQCNFCTTRSQLPPAALWKRPLDLIRQITDLIYNHPSRAMQVNGSRVRSLLGEVQGLEELTKLRSYHIVYSVPNPESTNFHLGLASIHVWLKDSPEIVAINLLDGLRCLGFDITAYPPNPRGILTPAQFIVTSWGVATDIVLSVFSMLITVYKTLCSELLPAVRGYGRRVYSMMMGQEATAAYDFVDLSPEAQIETIHAALG